MEKRRRNREITFIDARVHTYTCHRDSQLLSPLIFFRIDSFTISREENPSISNLPPEFPRISMRGEMFDISQYYLPRIQYSRVRIKFISISTPPPPFLPSFPPARRSSVRIFLTKFPFIEITDDISFRRVCRENVTTIYYPPGTTTRCYHDNRR